MRFWDRQAAARTHTRRLLLAFAFTVVVLLAAVHGALALAWWCIAWLLPGHLDFPAGFLVLLCHKCRIMNPSQLFL